MDISQTNIVKCLQFRFDSGYFAEKSYNKEGVSLAEAYSGYKGSLPKADPANINASYDALYIHQGLPQKYNSFIQSPYTPSTSNQKDKIYYY